MRIGIQFVGRIVACCTFEATAVLGLTLLNGGCGGGSLSPSEIQAMAIHRTDDEEEESSENATPKTESSSEPVKLPRQAQKASEKSDSAPAPFGNNSTSTSKAESDPPVAIASEQPLSDRREPPPTALSATDRCKLSAENMSRIITAILAHQKEHGEFPKRAISDKATAPLLSWRVALLPQLGYGNLYQQFRLNEPWNSPHNTGLLKHIPAVYQSPDRFDEKTNYLLPIAGNTAFVTNRSLQPLDIEDGLEHTVFLVEADDELAVPWTQPQDYNFARDKPAQGLGKLRNGQIFLAWGNGVTGAVPAGSPVNALQAMFTADAGEPFSSYSVSRPLDDGLFASAAAPGVSAEPALSTPAAVTSGTSSPAASTNSSDGLPTSQLARQCAEAAQAAFRNGETRDAIRWFYASLVSHAEQPSAAAFHWVAGLRRPMATIHFGVGLLRRTNNADRLPVSSGKSSGATRDAMQRLLKPVGSDFLGMIEEHAQTLAPTSLAAADPALLHPRRDRLHDPGPLGQSFVSYLGEGTSGELRKAAIGSACDVLVLFEAGDGSTRGSRFLSCQLVDLARDKSLLRLPRIVWFTNPGGPEAAARDEDYRKAKWRLADLLAEQLVFAEWPETLKPQHAADRVTALASANGMHPLAAMAEMGVYRDQKLIDNRRLLAGFRGVLGEEDGETLMLGDERSRARALRRWLPTEAPQSVRLTKVSTKRRSKP